MWFPPSKRVRARLELGGPLTGVRSARPRRAECQIGVACRERLRGRVRAEDPRDRNAPGAPTSRSRRTPTARTWGRALATWAAALSHPGPA